MIILRYLLLTMVYLFIGYCAIRTCVIGYNAIARQKVDTRVGRGGARYRIQEKGTKAVMWGIWFLIAGLAMIGLMFIGFYTL